MACACALALLGTGVHASAQTSPVALDVVAAVDVVQGSTPARNTAVWLDVFAAVRIGEGLDLVARPVISRRTFDGSWQNQMYQLGLRYEHAAARSGALGLRLEVGQLPSPIGIGMLENRADANPVVSQHSAYYLPLPRVDRDIPRAFLIAGAYPFGAQATVSARWWDARVAAIDSSPMRGRNMMGSNKPPRLLNVVGGFGVTPRVGLRLGAAVARGAYASVNEVTDRTRGDRDGTMVQVEGEWSFGYTKIVGEWIRSVMETARADAHVSGFWIESTQTLSPRLFIAGRADVQHFDYQRPQSSAAPVFERQRYDRYEAIAGFRLTRDLTLRGGYLVRKGYVVFHWDDQVIGSIVWQRKIW
jgi:hypothetical protein